MFYMITSLCSCLVHTVLFSDVKTVNNRGQGDGDVERALLTFPSQYSQLGSSWICSSVFFFLVNK